MIQHVDHPSQDQARIPVWKRVTALFSLGSLIVVIGLILAVAIGIISLMTLLVLERAITG